MSERYYSAKELAGLPGMPETERSVQRIAKCESWASRKRSGKGGGREYPESCLPTATRHHLKRQRVDRDLAQADERLQPMLPLLAPEELLLNDEQQLTMAARQAVIAAVNRLRVDHGFSLEMAFHTLIGKARTGELEPVLKRQLALCRDKRGLKNELPGLRTFKRWLSDEVLAPKVKQKNLKHPSWALDFLSCYQRPQKPSVSAAYAEFKANWAGTPPSIHAVRRYLDKLPEIELEKHRMGPRELKSLKPFVRRTFDELWPNDVWSADGHTFDAEVQHPLHGQPFRPEITGIIDIATRYMVGFSVTLKESALTTADALRHACEQSGIPAIFYVDNGSGYANDLLKNEALGILSRLGIEVRHSLPYNSQARGVIERVHRTIWVALAKTLPSYMGAEMDREAKQKFFKESRRGDVVRLPIGWRDFMRLCEDAVNSYNQRPHSSLPILQADGRRRHMSPGEYRAMKIQTIAGYRHHELNAEEAQSLFRPREVRKVSRGEINLFGNRYFSNALVEHHGGEIQVGYDVHDAQFVWLYDDNGQFIAKAEFRGNDKKYFPTPVIEQARDKRARNRMKNAVRVVEEIQAERKGAQALEVLPVEELPGLRATARKLEERAKVETATTIPASDQPQERYLLWRDLDTRAKAGEEIPEAYRAFYHAFPNTSAWRSWNAFYNHEPLNAVR